MSDQCKHCTVRGDYASCHKTVCSFHESWIGKTRVSRIKNLEIVGTALREYIDAIPGFVADRFPSMPGIDRDFVDNVLDEPQIEVFPHGMLECISELVEIVKLSHKEIGGCDHDVGICLCGEISILDNAVKLIEKHR